jgi:hypothetical protein
VEDDGYAVHYLAVEHGTPVMSTDGAEVGKVVEVLDNYREGILDGIVLEAPSGDLRFVDAPEVARTAERAVTLSITAAEAEELPPPEHGSTRLRPRGVAKRLGRRLGRVRRRG